MVSCVGCQAMPARCEKISPMKRVIVDRAADEHGDDHADALPAHDLLEHLRPFIGAVALGEGIEDERFVRATGHAFGHAAEDAIREAAEQEDEAAVGWARR